MCSFLFLKNDFFATHSLKKFSENNEKIIKEKFLLSFYGGVKAKCSYLINIWNFVNLKIYFGISNMGINKVSVGMDSLINGLETEIRGNKNKGELFKNMLL